MSVRLWIERGCICCQACTAVAPDLFDFVDGQAVMVAAVRIDGEAGRNEDEQSPLLAEVATAQAAAIREAVVSCPVEIIHLDEDC